MALLACCCMLRDAGTLSPPQVFSISYGSAAQGTTSAQRSRLDYELLKLGLRGITVTASTGDSGLQGGNAVSCTKFTTTVLATSPYITAVGGSTLWPTASGQAEVAVQADKGMYYTVSGEQCGQARQGKDCARC